MSILKIACPNCSELFNDSDDLYSTSCGHLFHLACMNDWKRRTTSCPKCHFYNPTTHKLYLSFDESDGVLEKQEEMEAKLKASNEKITQLLVQMSESETNFMKLQDQFTSVEKSKRLLEQRITRLQESGENFNRLLAQYTESTEHKMDLEYRINQLYIDNQTKSKELTLRTLENESLKASSMAGHSTSSNINSYEVLLKKIKILEQKLKHISDEYEKEISTSTQLTIEKMKLESYIKHFNPSEKIIKSTPKLNDKNDNNSRTEKDEKLVINHGNQNESNSLNTIYIRDLPLDQISIPLENVIINLAEKMKLSIKANDLIKVNYLNNNDVACSKTHLIAQFKNKKLKDEFLSKKKSLKNNPATRSVIICEFMDEEIRSLFNYAKQKLQSTGFKCIFCKDNMIFAKRHPSHNNAVHLKDKAQIDQMYNLNKNDNVSNPEKLNTVDENLYQL